MSTEADRVADLIGHGAAWWKRAAEALEAGDVVQAEQYALLGQLGTEGMHERIASMAGVSV